MAIVSNNLYAYPSGVLVNPSPIPAGTPYTPTGLASDTSYSYTATNINDAGLESVQSDPFTFTTAVYVPPPGESPLSTADAAAVDAILAAEMSKNPTIPGFIISVTGPRGYYKQAYGKQALGLGATSLTTDDHFRMGSLTKSFTAMAFWMAVDDGLVKLTDVLETYVPGVPNGTIITMEQILTMRSGVYNYTSNFQVLLGIELNPAGAFSQAQALALIKGNAGTFTPGSQYAYENSNAILIRAVVEAVRPGRLFPEILQDDILTPLGMTETEWPADANIPLPATLKNNRFNPEYAGAAGALTSTIGDLSIWAKAMRDGLLISPASHTTWTTVFPSTGVATPGVHPPSTFDYGHFVFHYGDWIGHDGEVSQFGAACAFDMVSGATISVSVNTAAFAGDGFYVVLRNIAALLYPSSLT